MPLSAIFVDTILSAGNNRSPSAAGDSTRITSNIPLVPQFAKQPRKLRRDRDAPL